MSGKIRTRLVRVSAVIALCASLLPLGAQVALGASATITSAGPLSSIIISDELNCQVAHTGDSSYEFYPGGSTLGACATLLATGGTLFGPTGIPAGGGATPRTPFTTVSQSAVTGAGTAASPYRIVTIVTLGTTGLRITETDSYVVGQESYRTDTQVTNTGNSAATAILYRAGDCYLQNSDDGYGRVDGSAPACTASTDPGSRIEQWYPLSPGSRYYEADFDDVWAQIGSQTQFPNTCICSTFTDNGAGLSWNLSIAAGQSVTRSHLTLFSPLGRQPLSTAKTADSPSSTAGATNGYTITISNPNLTAAALTGITDTLPAGFTYVSGSTTGATTANPSVSGQNLTWSGPFSVPAEGDLSLNFDVTVSSTPGTYFNNAGATSAAETVAPTGDTAPIEVTAGGADVGRVQIHSKLCKVIGDPGCRNGIFDHLPNYKISYNIFSGTDKSVFVEKRTVTLGKTNGVLNGTNGAEGYKNSSLLPIGMYTVCEVPVAFKTGVPNIRLTVQPRPADGNGGSTGGTQVQYRSFCITVQVTANSLAELDYLSSRN